MGVGESKSLSSPRSPLLLQFREAKREATKFSPRSACAAAGSPSLLRPLWRREGGGTPGSCVWRVHSRGRSSRGATVVETMALRRNNLVPVPPPRRRVRRRRTGGLRFSRVLRPGELGVPVHGRRGGGGDHAVGFCPLDLAPSPLRFLRRDLRVLEVCSGACWCGGASFCGLRGCACSSDGKMVGGPRVCVSSSTESMEGGGAGVRRARGSPSADAPQRQAYEVHKAARLRWRSVGFGIEGSRRVAQRFQELLRVFLLFWGPMCNFSGTGVSLEPSSTFCVCCTDA